MNFVAARYLLATIVLFAGVMLFVPRIPQSLVYHLFADVRDLFGIPNFWNVVSNIPFAIVGIVGLIKQSGVGRNDLLLPYRIFCVGVIAVAAGSAYYHFDPDNTTLVWDRLPMTIAFMSLFSAVLGDSVLPQQNNRVLTALIAIGLASIAYWHVSEQMGAGDLRPYALVQFFPMLAIPLILIRGSLRNLSSKWLWFTLVFYVLAKVFEHFDAEIFYVMSQLQSGHSIKHVSAALACTCVINAFWVTRRTQEL